MNTSTKTSAFLTAALDSLDVIDYSLYPSTLSGDINIPGNTMNATQLGRAVHNIEYGILEAEVTDSKYINIYQPGTAEYMVRVSGSRNRDYPYFVFNVERAVWNPGEDDWGRYKTGEVIFNMHPVRRSLNPWATRNGEHPSLVYSKHVYIAAFAKTAHLHIVTDDAKKFENAVIAGYRREKAYRNRVNS